MALTSKFLADLLAHVPEANRAAVQAALEASPDAQAFAEAGAKRQSEFSREMDRLRAEDQRIKDFHAQQLAWYEQNQEVLEAGKQALAAGVPPAAPAAPQLPADVVRAADFEKTLNQRERGAVAFITASHTLAARHLQQFGEPLDLEAIVNDPDAGKLGLEGTYRKLHADKLSAHAAALQEKTIEERVAARLAEERKAFANRPPYPVSQSEVSPLDALGTPDKPDPSQFSAESAADEYMRLVAARG